MPGLVTLDLVLSGFEVRYPGLLREDRCRLATMLKLRLEEAKTISGATLDMSLDGGAINQMLPMPNLTYPSEYDLLGSSLSIWSQRLTKLYIKGVLDEALFWPHASETATSPPEWLNLEKLDVHLERHTPSGWWYFMPKGKPKYGTPPRNPAEDPNDLPLPFTDNPADGADPFDKEDEDNWDFQRTDDAPEEDLLTRNVPNEDTMQPLFEGWAKALRSMPSLRQARLAFEVEIPNSKTNDEEDLNTEDWEVIYQSPDFHNPRWERELGAGERSSRRLIFHNTCGWRPNKATMDLLRCVGEESHPGTKVVVLAINEWNKILR